MGLRRKEWFLMQIENYPSKEVKEFGEQLTEALLTMSNQSSMKGLGGCKAFDINSFQEEFHPYLLEYLKGNHDSLAIIYAAMKTKEQEIKFKYENTLNI